MISIGFAVRGSCANGGASFARSFIKVPTEEGFLEALRDCLAAYQAAGFGEFKLSHLEPFGKLDTNHGKVLIQACDAFEAWAANQNGKHAERVNYCAYTAGVLVGFVNVLADSKDIICVERSCQGKGDDYCRFELTPIDPSHDPVEGYVAVDPDPALSRRLNLLEILFERMPMGIVLLDSNFHVRRFNPTWVEFVNRYRPAPSVPVAPGINFLDLVSGNADLIEPVFQRVLSGETIYQHAFQLKVGESDSYWDAVNTPLVENGEVVGILQVTVDVTDRERTHQDLRNAIEQLRMREERLTLVMEGINDGIWDWDLKTDQVYYSPRWKEMLGYKEEEVPNEFEAWRELVHPEDIDQALVEIKDYLGGRSPQYNLEHRLRHRDGSYRWMLARGTALRDETGKPYRMVGSHTDITSRKLVEGSLRQSEANLRSLMENAENFVVYQVAVDRSNSHGGRVVLVSPSIKEILGVSDPYDFDSWFNDLHPEDYPRVLEANRRAVEEGIPYSETVRWYHRGKQAWIWIHTAYTPVSAPGGEISHFNGLMFDSSKQKRAEAELEESQRRLSTLISNLPGMAYRCRNDQDWTMEFVSEGSFALTGYRPEELINSRTVSYGSLIHPDDRDNVWNEVHAALREDRPFQFTYRIKTPQKEKWVWEQGQGVSNARGETIALEGFISDITERVMAQQNLEQRVKERTQELSTLLEISHNLASMLELEPLLDVILDQLGTVVEYDAASIMILDGEILKILAYRGPIVREEALQIKFSIHEARANQRVIQGQEPVIIEDILGVGTLARAIRETAGNELETTYSYLRCWMGVPLILKNHVIGMLTLDHQQSGYYGPSHAELAMAFASQAAVAIENARLYQQAEQSAITHERNRLARDLHDAVTQTLFSTSLIADVLPRLWQKNAEMGHQKLEELRMLTRGALSEMRTLLFELRPDSFRDVELGDLYQHLTTAFSGRTRIPVLYTQEGQSALPPDVKEVFYRVAQEALNNISKHAQASEVQVQLRESEESVEVIIQDNGCGFDLQTVSSENLGLKIMRERAEAVQAEVEIQSAPGVGTHMTVRWHSKEENK